MNLKKELDDNKIVLSIFSKNYYNESIYEVLRKLKGKKVCYVTLNKTVENLERSLEFRKLSANKMFFIDAVSRTVGEHVEKDNALFVSSPGALTELSIAITESLNSGAFDVILFDSLSTLNIYQIKSKAAQVFTSSVINKIKSNNKQGVFTCLEKDLNSELIKNSFMYVDKVLHPSLFYHSFKNNQTRRNLIIYSATAILLGIAGFFSFGGRFIQQLTGYSILESSPADPNFLPLLGGVSIFSLIFFIGAVVYKKYTLRLISDEELEQMEPDSDTSKFKNKVKKKLLGWLNKN